MTKDGLIALLNWVLPEINTEKMGPVRLVESSKSYEPSKPVLICTALPVSDKIVCPYESFFSISSSRPTPAYPGSWDVGRPVISKLE